MNSGKIRFVMLDNDLSIGLIWWAEPKKEIFRDNDFAAEKAKVAIHFVPETSDVQFIRKAESTINMSFERFKELFKMTYENSMTLVESCIIVLQENLRKEVLDTLS